MIFADLIFRRTRILADVLSFQIIQMQGFCVFARHSHTLQNTARTKNETNINKSNKRRCEFIIIGSSTSVSRLQWQCMVFVSVSTSILTFLNHPNDSDGGFALARHFNVTFSRSARIITRFGTGSSLAKCTDTMGASVKRVGQQQKRKKIVRRKPISGQ